MPRTPPADPALQPWPSGLAAPACLPGLYRPHPELARGRRPGPPLLLDRPAPHQRRRPDAAAAVRGRHRRTGRPSQHPLCRPLPERRNRPSARGANGSRVRTGRRPVDPAHLAPDGTTLMAGNPDAVLVEPHGHVLLVTINRPAALNAVNREVSRGLGHALE